MPRLKPGPAAYRVQDTRARKKSAQDRLQLLRGRLAGVRCAWPVASRCH